MKEPSGSKGQVLLLTNNSNTGELYEWLLLQEGGVVRYGEALSPEIAALILPSFAVSFNYRHVLDCETISALSCEIVNVHCSVLPWNRGASPNFFSYYENTPKGVTIHRLEGGLDKGSILLQKVLSLDESETFRSSYNKLITCAIEMLKENWNDLKHGTISARKQPSGGTYHAASDFERIRLKYPFDWDDQIKVWKQRNNLN